jgi:hypothetical protein
MNKFNVKIVVQLPFLLLPPLLATSLLGVLGRGELVWLVLLSSLLLSELAVEAVLDVLLVVVE